MRQCRLRRSTSNLLQSVCTGYYCNQRQSPLTRSKHQCRPSARDAVLRSKLPLDMRLSCDEHAGVLRPPVFDCTFQASAVFAPPFAAAAAAAAVNDDIDGSAVLLCCF
jgi:hypothetical protein